jgi:hypothetical protein
MWFLILVQSVLIILQWRGTLKLSWAIVLLPLIGSAICGILATVLLVVFKIQS